MDPAKYVYKSDFARFYITVGREEAVMDQLAVKFGPLSDDVKNRLGAASVTELGAIGKRLLFAGTLEEALGELQ